MFGEVIAEDAYETVPLASLEAATAFLTRVKEGSAPLSLMYETEGLLPHLTLTSLSGAHDHKVYVWDKALLNDANMLALLCDGAIKKIVPNPKELYKFMQGKGVSLQGVIGDPSLAAYLYEPGETHYDVKSLAETYLPASCGGTAQDVEALMPVLEGLMAERGLTELYRDIELPLTKVLANMEVNGITLDKGMLDEVTKSMTKQVADLEQKAKEEAGEDFNVNSPKQLGVILFEKIGPSHHQKDKIRLFHGCERPGTAAGRTSHHRDHHGVPYAVKAFIHVLSGAPSPHQSQYGPHPYPFQSDGDRDRTAFQYGSKSAEHPYPDGSRQANAPDVCTRQRV